MTNLSYGDYFTAKSTTSGLIYRGWFIKTYADDHKIHPGATLFVEESKDSDGNESFRPATIVMENITRLIEGDDNYRALPPAARTVATYANAYQGQREETLVAQQDAAELRTKLHEEMTKVQTLQSDLGTLAEDRDHYQNAILRMFEIASSLGYSSEAQTIMDKAGVALPPMPDFEVKVKVEGYLTFTRAAYSQDKAEAMIRQEDVEYMLEDTSMDISYWEIDTPQED